MKLEKRILADPYGGTIDTLGDVWVRGSNKSRPSIWLYARENAKKVAWLRGLLFVVLLVVSTLITWWYIWRDQSPVSWVLWTTFVGIIGFSLIVYLYWPFPESLDGWREAVQFVEALRYAEEVTGPFEQWTNIRTIEVNVVQALRLELRSIERMRGGDTSMYEKFLSLWKYHHGLMCRLFPSIPDKKQLIDSRLTPSIGLRE